jgi:hypothetical protein
MPPIGRAEVDETFLDYFADVALDLEATREQLASVLSRGLDEATARRDAAEREVMLATERLARVRRDYADKKLDATDWREFRDEFEEERSAAEAEHARLAQHVADLKQQTQGIDAETELVQRLADLRASVAGSLDANKDIPALRAAMAATFHRIELVMSDDGERDLVPYLRLDETWAPTEEQFAAIREAASKGAPPPKGTFPVKKASLQFGVDENCNISTANPPGPHACRLPQG